MGAIKSWDHGRLEVSDNGRFLQHENGKPFFWQGDTAWLLFTRLTKEETITFLKNRQQKGYNVIQVMVIHDPSSANMDGRLPFIDQNFTKADLTIHKNGVESFWDHVDWVVEKAAEMGMYMAMVPVWGHNVKKGLLSVEAADQYGAWLGRRYRQHPNVIWLNGGDLHGYTKTEIWLSLGKAIRKVDPYHLMTFHPFGRSQSSTWFHNEDWLDFNMVQSGHRRYDQIGEDHPSTWKGEDNWKFISEDYARYPAKPTLDGEPSYEGVPHGLHDPSEPFWNEDDSRRFMYWAVFAGACGHTYGHSAIMQMYKPDYESSYGNELIWNEAMDAAGSFYITHLGKLIMSRPFFERIPDQTVINGDPGFRYNRLLVTRGDDYLFAYIYTGRSFELQSGCISGDELKAWWFNPKNGESKLIGTMKNTGILSFNPPGEEREANDWVLVLDNTSKNFNRPGEVE